MKQFGVVFAAVGLTLALAACASSPTTGEAAMTYTGYLLDVACGGGGKGMDGSDVVKAPQDHTKACLVACAASGFGISVKDGGAYKFIPFDKSGSDLALKSVVNMTSKTKAISVEVKGTVRDGLLQVQSIKEIALGM